MSDDRQNTSVLGSVGRHPSALVLLVLLFNLDSELLGRLSRVLNRSNGTLGVWLALRDGGDKYPRWSNSG